MLVEELKKLGFPQKEAAVYITLLSLPEALVSDIARQAKLKRTTTYVILESLCQKGLAAFAEKDGIKYYSATPPERIIAYLQDKAKELAQMVGHANTVIPELKSIYVGVGPKPKIQFLEGAEGIKAAYEDTLTSTETIRAYASIENMHKALPDYFPEYYRRRAGKGIKIRAVFPDTDEAKERMTYNKKEAREAYLVPKEKYSFSPEINIYDDKIVFMSLIEKFALIIQSEELANALKKVFELSWEEAKEQHTLLIKKKK